VAFPKYGMGASQNDTLVAQGATHWRRWVASQAECRNSHTEAPVQRAEMHIACF
jgi:hypothetical protein